MDFVDLKTQYAALRESIDARIQRVLDHGQYIMGPEVTELEAALAARTGAAHCVTAASGTEALLIALLALEVKPGDEVITTPFSFAAAAEMIALIGARPVFVDVDEDTANIAAAGIEAAITPRTRAIIPAALYGQPADMDEIDTIAVRHRLRSSRTPGFGATYRPASGNLSTIGCAVSSLPLACYGDGGAVSERPALAKAMRIPCMARALPSRGIGVSGRSYQCAIVLASSSASTGDAAAHGNRRALRRAAASSSSSAGKIKGDRTSVYAQYGACRAATFDST